MSPLLFNAVRMVRAAVALWAIFWKDMQSLVRPAAGNGAAGNQRTGIGTIKAGLLVGTFLTLGYEFQTAGLRLTSASKSAFLTGSSVVIVPIILAVAYRRHINRWTTIGFISAFAGLYFMTVPAGRGGEGWASVNRGDLLTMACA